MRVELLTVTSNPEIHCARAMKTCRTSIKPYEIELTLNEARTLLKKAVKDKHLSVLEHASFSFSISGISRSCSHQLVRHRIASYSQQSLRAVDLSKASVEDLFVFPKTIQESLKSETCATIRYRNALFDALITYKNLIFEGIPKEDARFILPLATKTNIVVTMNARELLHFFSLRIKKDAQWEIRDMANRMLVIMRLAMPSVFGGIKYE